MNLLDFYHLKNFKNMDFFYKNIKYSSSIKCILNDSFIIERVGNISEFIPINKGEKLEFFVTIDGALLKCECEVNDLKSSDSTQVIGLKQPKIIKKFERRTNYRQIAVLDMNYCVFPLGVNYLDISDVPLEYLKNMKTCKLINISAGGVMIFTNEEWTDGCQGIIQIPMQRCMNVIVSLIRTKKDKINDGSYIYEIALKYEGLRDEEKDEIVEFINEKIAQ